MKKRMNAVTLDGHAFLSLIIHFITKNLFIVNIVPRGLYSSFVS